LQRRRSVPKEGTDLWAVYNGYISVTPLHMDMTHYQSLAALTERLGGPARG
jgi:5'-nucleotidase